MSLSEALRALGALLGLVRAVAPDAVPKPLLTYTKAQGGWYCHYRGKAAFGLTKRDAATAVLRLD